MPGDFTRDTRARAVRTATRAVLIQQGRPLLDTDLNEQAGLVAERSEAIVRHVIGRRGVPRDDAGFGIAASAGGFSIGAGALYAEGLPLDNPSPVAYAEQIPGRDFLLPLTEVLADGQEALVYVQALLHASPDPALPDPALEGVDTAVREVAGWTVRVAPLAAIAMPRPALIEALDRNGAIDIAPWRNTTGGLDADVDAANPDPGPCEVAATAGYLDQFNRLYRVEIHADGAPGTATFKWTEDASRDAPLRASGAGFAIDLPHARTAEWFPEGTVVEVYDGANLRAGVPGPMGAITSAPGALLAISGIAASDLSATSRIRRWAAMPAPVPAGAAWAVLAKNVRVRFSAGHFVQGSAWTIPARTVLGDIAWPPYGRPDVSETVDGATVGFYAPMEGRRYHAALALVRRTLGNFAVTADLRDLFPPLTDLTADKVRFDDRSAGLGAKDVQQAIDALATRQGACCTWHAGPSSDLQALVDGIPPRANGTLCLATGNYDLKGPLRIAGKGHVRVVGAGPGSKLWCRSGPQALVIEDCLSAEISDLLVAAEAPGVPVDLRHTAGALDIANTGPVHVLRATLIAQGRRWKQSAALRIACSDKPGGGDVTVDDCDVVAGDLATGILVIDADVLRVTGNRIRPRAEPPEKTLDRWLQDKAIAAAVGRLAMSHAMPAGATPRPRPTTRSDRRLFADRRLLVRDHAIDIYASTLIDDGALATLAPLLAAELPGGDSRSYRLRLRRMVSVILAHRGRPPVAGTAYTGFLKFYLTIVRAIAATPDAGIVVGGKHARDVTIAGNRIEGVFRGIRVGVNAGVPLQRLPLGSTRVERNFVRLRVVPADVVRVGIYVGNVERAWLVDNDVAAETADRDFRDPRAELLRQQRFDALHSEGITIFGLLGPFIQVRGNSVLSCATGYTLHATPDTDSRAKLWLLQGNYAAGAARPYTVDARCRKVDCV